MGKSLNPFYNPKIAYFSSSPAHDLCFSCCNVFLSLSLSICFLILHQNHSIQACTQRFSKGFQCVESDSDLRSNRRSWGLIPKWAAITKTLIWSWILRWVAPLRKLSNDSNPWFYQFRVLWRFYNYFLMSYLMLEYMHGVWWYSSLFEVTWIMVCDIVSEIECTSVWESVPCFVEMRNPFLVDDDSCWFRMRWCIWWWDFDAL